MPNSLVKVLGGGFLLAPCGGRPTFIPENINEAQRELAGTAARFAKEEALSVTGRIEASEAGLVPSLIRKAGEIGLLMAEIPEEYGGLGLSKIDSAVIAENMTHQGSFSVAIMCHTGIGTLPLLYYGTPEQKTKYLPKLATGEMIGAYALTEAEAGSDALAVRTRAVLSPDGKYYILNGEKMYCTNGGIADLITVFAKVDGEKFTAFLVEKGRPGVSTGREESKMGIHGSSTTSIILNDAKIPEENVLGEIGRGHKIAFNTLNIGRFKLGAACVGSCKRMIETVAQQANNRRQFGKQIGQFELIRQKIARMTCLTYLLESLAYRYAGDLDASLLALDKGAADYWDRLHGAIEELSVEAAVAKIFGSEALSFVADEAVQIFGGSGYIKDFIVEQAYRDCRVNRIFEGTNEICRLVIPGTLIKRAMAGHIPLMQRLGDILKWFKGGFPEADRSRPYATYIDQVERLKHLAVYLTGVAARKFADGLKEYQAIVTTVADLVTWAYAFDCGLGRAIAVHEMGETDRAGRFADICAAMLAEHVPVLTARARQALINIAKGDVNEYTPYLKALERIASVPALDTDAIYDRIAARVLEGEKYNL